MKASNFSYPNLIFLICTMLFSQFSTADVAPNMLTRFAPILACTASDATTGLAYGEATLKIENSPDPLIELISQNVSRLNFKFGRRNTSGKDFSKRDTFTCAFYGIEKPNSDALFYYCADSLGLSNSPKYSEVKNTPFRSSLSASVSDSTAFRVCKNSNFCIDLVSCTPAKKEK